MRCAPQKSTHGRVACPAPCTRAPASPRPLPEPRILTNLINLLMVPASCLRLHGPRCLIRWGGLALAGPRSLHPVSGSLTP